LVKTANPLKYTDPDGRDIDETDKKIMEAVFNIVNDIYTNSKENLGF
jgi:hypothetical protein